MKCIGMLTIINRATPQRVVLVFPHPSDGVQLKPLYSGYENSTLPSSTRAVTTSGLSILDIVGNREKAASSIYCSM